MYQECLDVFDAILCDAHIMDDKRNSFNANYTELSEKFESWKNTMISLYGPTNPNTQFLQFTEKLQDFMNHLLILYASLSDKGNADIQERPHFAFTETTQIYSKFYLMMCECPWTSLHNDAESTKNWKQYMIWMGKRLFYIGYYTDKLKNYQAWSEVREFIHYFVIQEARTDEDLWNDGAPTWFIRSRRRTTTPQPSAVDMHSLLQSLSHMYL